MYYESNCDLEVLLNLFKREAFLKKGDTRGKDIRPTLFVGGGVLRGVDGAARACALEDHYLHQVFTHVCGTSTGAASGQFLLTGQTREHINIYWKEAASKEFISFRRFFSGEHIEDTCFLSDVFQSKLALEAARRAAPAFYVGVTHAKTGEGRFIDAKADANKFHEAVRASMAIPYICGEPVYIDSEPYYDGMGAMSLPLPELLAQCTPTDLLVFANAPCLRDRPLWARVLEDLCLSSYPPELAYAFRNRAASFSAAVQKLRQTKDVRWMLIWSEDIGIFERDPRTLQFAAHVARRETYKLIAEAKRQFQEENTPHAA